MKICSLCKSKYDDRVDFCFRDGTPLVPLDDAQIEPEAAKEAEDIFSSATRPFVLGSAGATAPADLPPTPDRFSTGDGHDVPEPGFGFADAAAVDAPEPSAVGVGEASVEPTQASASPEALEASEIRGYLDAPEPPADLDAPEPAALEGSEALDAPQPVNMRDSANASLTHSETIVPPDEAHATDAPASEKDSALPGPTVSTGFGMAEEFDDSFAPVEETGSDVTGDDSEDASVPDLLDSVFDPADEEGASESSSRILYVFFAIGGIAAVVAILLIVFGQPGQSPPEQPEPQPAPVAQVHHPPQPTPAPPPHVPEPVTPPPEEQDVADILDMPTDQPGGDQPESAPTTPGPEPAVPVERPQPQPGSSQPTPTQPEERDPEPEALPWGQAGDPGATTDEPSGEREIWGGGTTQPAPAATDGTLTIRSNPMGAMVYVGNNQIGLTPLVGKELTVGSHMVRIELDGYSTVSKVANIKAGVPTDLGTVQLESQAPVSGYVTLWADDLNGAKLYIDNQYVGELPVKVELNEGEHTFFVQPPAGDAFTVPRNVHFDVQGIGMSINLGDR